MLTGRKELAEPLFQKCLRIYNKLDMEYIPTVMLHDMAGLLYADDPVKAAVYLQEAMSTENKLCWKNWIFYPRQNACLFKSEQRYC